MKTFISIMLFLFGATLLHAQKSSVSGKIIDFHDKNTLANAEISLGSQKTKSDENGEFSFQNVSKGTYNFTAKHPDCEPFSEKLVVDKNMEITVVLEHHSSDIQTITLHGNHKSNAIIIEKTLDKEEISRNSTENLGNLLTSISGVSALKTGNNISKPIIHGLYGSRVPIMNNGVKMAEQEWGVEHAPNIDVNQFEHIDVIKGASALKYGSDAIGGVVVLEPEIFKKQDTLKGSAQMSAISNGRGLGFDLNLIKTYKNGWAIKTDGGYRKLGDLHSPDYNLMNTGLDFNSFGFTVQKNSFLQGISFDYSITNQEIGIFRGSHIGNLEDFYQVLNSDIPLYQRDFSYDIDNPKQNIQHHIAKIATFKRFENLGKVSIDYSFQYNHRKEYDVRRGELAEIPSLDLELITNQLNINDLIERPKWSLENGANLLYQNNYSTPSTMARRLVPNYDKYGAGIYSIFKYKINSEMNAEAGLRYDFNSYNVKKWYDLSDWQTKYAADFPQFYVKTEGNRVYTEPNLDFQNLSFNAGLEYHPSANFNVKFNYAKVSRTPNIAELFADGLHHSASILEVGSLGLKSEDGNQFSVSLDGEIPFLESLKVSVNPYLFLTKNFITQVPTGVQNTIRGIFPVWTYQQIDARMFGVDFDAQLKFANHFSYVGRFSYVNGEDISNNQPLILMVPPNFSNAIEFNEKSWKNFYLKVENQTFLHQSRFPINNPSISIFENGVAVEKVIDLSTPPPTYSLWNLHAGLDFNKHFTAGWSVSNLLNTNYKDYLNRMRYFSYEMGRNFILHVKYNF